MPTRIEANGQEIAKLPDDSFIAFRVPAGDITLSATPMFNFHYDDEDRMTLSASVGKGEIAYFRVVSVFGSSCAEPFETVDSREIASTTHYPRPDWAQTACFQRVPENVVLKALKDLKRGN